MPGKSLISDTAAPDTMMTATMGDVSGDSNPGAVTSRTRLSAATCHQGTV